MSTVWQQASKTAAVRVSSTKCAVFVFLLLPSVGLLTHFIVINTIGTNVIAKYNYMTQYWTYHNHTTAYQLLDNYTTKQALQKNKTDFGDYFQPVTRGSNVQAGDRQVHVTTAVHYKDYPKPQSFNLLLNGWAKFKTNMDFKCCLIPSLNADKSHIIEVEAKVYHIYEQWIVDMQSAEFSCSLPKKNITSKDNEPFRYVTFVEKNCSASPTFVTEIEYPTTMKNSVAICLKISYGDLDLEKMLEWFEYAKLLNVTRVFTFLSPDLNPEARRIFEYYNATGFVEVNPINPAIAKNGTKRGFRRPRYEQQAWVDEVMACNDCKHRMSGFDYVVVQDIDEYVVPKLLHGSYLSILKEASRQYPKAGSFRLDSNVAALDWNQTRSSPVHLMSKIHRTSFSNYDDPGTDSRWAFMPHRTFFVRNNLVTVRKPYNIVGVPRRLFTLQHRRRCKKQWDNCPHLDSRHKVRDTNILQNEARLISALKRLPLTKLLPGTHHASYIKGLKAWRGQTDAKT